MPPRLTDFLRDALASLSSADRRSFLLLAGARTAISGIDLLAILALGAGVERLSTGGGRSALTLLLGAGVGMLLRSVGTLLIARATFRFLARVEVSVGGEFTESVFSAPQEVLDGLRMQEIAFAVSQGTNSLTTRALGFAIIAVADGLATLALVAAFTISYPLEGVLMVVSVLSLMVPVHRHVSRRIHTAASKWSAAMIRVLNEVQEFQACRREIFLNSASRSAAAQLGQNRFDSANQAAEFNFMLTVPRAVIEVATLVTAAVLLAVAYLRQSADEFVVFSAILMAVTFRAAPLAMGVVGSLGVITQSRGETLVNRRILHAVTGLASRDGSQALSDDETTDPSTAVNVRNLGYRFPGTEESYALNSVSLRVGKNEVCAIVGPSGAGKTTLLECIVGLRTASNGQVQLFGSDPASLRENSPGSIGLVSQVPAIRSASIADNVSFLSPSDPDRGRVAELIEQVGLGPLLGRCPAGIDTMVGEGNLQLSGGERQRLGLARALYTDPDLLVLDEPTSALDGLSEEHIFTLLEHERNRRTIIVVTHRRPVGFKFDQVFVVSGGRVAVE